MRAGKGVRGVTRVGRAVVAAVLVVGVVTACSSAKTPRPAIVIGTTTTSALPGPTIAVAPPSSMAPTTVAPRPRVTTGRVTALPPMRVPDGAPWPPAVPFFSDIEVAPELVFVLVVGGDARTGEDVRRSHADSLHVVAVDPRTESGTIIGIPRDSWVELPGRGRGKITSALTLGGPELLVAAVHKLTGLPIHAYVLTGFDGFMVMVDAIGGLDIPIEQRMNDRASGARFQPGWHRLTGGEVLAFTRNRYDVPGGDFGRSLNQGTALLAALASARATVGDDEGLRSWIDILARHAEFDASPLRLLELAAVARRIDVAKVTNLVVPGRIGWAGGASVVFLDERAAAIFNDVRDDAVVTPA